MLSESKHEYFSSWYSGQSASTVGFSPEHRVVPSIQPDGFMGVDQTSVTGMNAGRPLVADDRTNTDLPFAINWQGGERDWGPSSDHAGGVVIHSFGDGHAHAILESIDPTVYYRMITRAGREPDLGSL